MEELKTTEVLDREILEDARKKAYKILKTADDALAAQKRECEEKISSAIDSARKAYSQREKKTATEIFARLPLDKRRFRSETAEGFLIKAMDDFLRSLSREKLLSVVEAEVSEKINACICDFQSNDKADGKADDRNDGKIEVRYSGIELSEAKKILENAFNSNKSLLNLCAFAPPSDGTLVLPFIEINTKALKITASVEDAAASLLKEKRSELAAALLGEGVLND